MDSDPSRATTTARYLARWIVVGDRDGTVLADGALDIDDSGTLQYVGTESAAPNLPAAVSQHRLDGALVPGLVNTHCHTPMTLFRGVGEGLPLERWLHEVMWPREARLQPDDIVWGMRLGSAEMLRHGVTTSVEMYFHPESVAEAVTATGARVIVGAPLLALPGAPAGTLERQLANSIAQKAELEIHHRIEVAFAPHAAYTVPIPILQEVAAAAREHDALLELHVAETSTEGAALEASYGGASVPRVLADNDILGGRVLGAHCVWMTDEDLDLWAEHGASVAHCPQSNAKLASGIARLGAMLEHGIKVGLGTDGPASNNNLDLWEELRLAALLARLTSSDAQSLPAAEAFWLATGGGAAAIGRPDLGVLERGRAADFSRIDTDDAAFVPVASATDILTHLVWSASSRQVRDVWVGGARVVTDGVLTTIDEAEARAQVQGRALRLAAG